MRFGLGAAEREMGMSPAQRVKRAMFSDTEEVFDMTSPVRRRVNTNPGTPQSILKGSQRHAAQTSSSPSSGTPGKGSPPTRHASEPVVNPVHSSPPGVKPVSRFMSEAPSNGAHRANGSSGSPMTPTSARERWTAAVSTPTLKGEDPWNYAQFTRLPAEHVKGYMYDAKTKYVSPSALA